MRVLIALSAAGASLALFTSIAAAGADLRVTALDCESHPRRIRVENLGDTAQSLSGWQLQSDPAEGQPFDLGEVGSLGAGQKFFVFEGHLSPPTAPDTGYYRWGSDEIFNLRANDSTDYVRIVDPQGNTIDQRNCEGLPPGATPAPPTEYDPPPLVAPVVTNPPTAVPAPAATAPAAAAQAVPAGGSSGSSGATSADAEIPALGGPPLADQSVPATLPLATGAVALAVSMLLLTLGLRSRKSGA
jgi:hypothetical protein